ncbi:MAG TPA: DUF5937 family protein [Actinotalea caeni]|uniref:DUF5937 family protein n=1 Tax=Actinotalea caeni TaxID=1348467 RepID=UPI002B4B9462|nr:DUF5937 family protein [Actinotalea caeni]HLV56309.1 DUF5937 family protein [Actinotalea caeni]
MLATLALDPAAVLQARFATSPVWEAAAATRVLAQGAHTFHGTWVAQTRAALRRTATALPTLDLLVPPSGHMADLLTPAPTGRAATLEDDLARIRATPVELVLEDLEHLARSTRSPERRRALAEAARDPGALLEAACTELAALWRLCLAPAWPRLQALADADIAHRGRRVAEVGVARALSELHPRLRVDGDAVTIRTACLDEPLEAVPTELVLVPCAFTWPDPLVLNHRAHPLTIAYAPRGVGTLWQTSAAADGLAGLTGGTRAHALRLLDIPMTTSQLAEQLALTPATVSEHLQILARAGVVRAERQGRRVYYARTPLGDGLVTGAVAGVPA